MAGLAPLRLVPLPEGQGNVGQGGGWKVQKVLAGGRILHIPCPAGSAQGAQCPTPSAAQEQGPRSSIFPHAPGRDLSSRAQESETAECSGQVGKGSWERKRENEEEGEKKTSWQVFRAQSRSGNTSLPLIASRPDEFLEETATEMLHKSHCCACVGCLLKEVKGHRLWCIKKKKIMIF